MSVRFLSFLTCLSVLFAVAIMAGTAQAEAIYDDFSTNPNLADDWSQYIYYGASADAAWDATDLDLDLSAGLGDRIACLYRTDPAATRSATDPVTLKIKEYVSGGNSNDWASVGLIIAKNAVTALVDDTSPRYAFEIETADGGTSWNYRVRVGATGLAETIYASAASPSAAAAPKLDIVRDGDNYKFLADDELLCTDNAVVRWTQADADDLTYYEIIWGSGGSMTMSATVDNFGVVVPEPTTFALMATGALGFLLVALRRRRRN